MYTDLAHAWIKHQWVRELFECPVVQDVLDLAFTHCGPEPIGAAQVGVDAGRVDLVALEEEVSWGQPLAVLDITVDGVGKLLDRLFLWLACNDYTKVLEYFNLVKELLDLCTVELKVLPHLKRLPT